MTDKIPPQAEQPAQPQPGGAPLWDNAQALTSEMLELGRVLARLLMVELKLTLHDLPRAIAAALGLAVVGWLSWLGLSLLVGWGAYAYFGNAGAGIGGFLALNVAVAVWLALKLRGLLSEATLPATRRQLRAIMARNDRAGPERTSPELPEERPADERKAPTSLH